MVEKDPAKDDRNIAKRGLSLDLAEQLDWATALIWEDNRKDYGERRYSNRREVKRYEKAIESRKVEPR